MHTYMNSLGLHTRTHAQFDIHQTHFYLKIHELKIPYLLGNLLDIVNLLIYLFMLFISEFTF